MITSDLIKYYFTLDHFGFYVTNIAKLSLNSNFSRWLISSHTHESSLEIVPECVGRKSTIIPGGKRQVQPLISEVAKKMRMSSNLAKRKRPKDEPAHPEDDWHDLLHFASQHIVATYIM